MNEQIEAIKKFEQYLVPLRIVFPRSFNNFSSQINSIKQSADKSFNANKQRSESVNVTFNLSTFLYRQKIILHGYERKKLKYIPKVCLNFVLSSYVRKEQITILCAFNFIVLKIIFECGEQLRKLAFKWKSDDIDSKSLKKIQKISNQFSKDLINSSKYVLNQIKKNAQTFSVI